MTFNEVYKMFTDAGASCELSSSLWIVSGYENKNRNYFRIKNTYFYVVDFGVIFVYNDMIECYVIPPRTRREWNMLINLLTPSGVST